MKEAELKDYRSLIVVPASKDRLIRGLRNSEVYLEETRGALRLLTADEKAYLRLVAKRESDLKKGIPDEARQSDVEELRGLSENISPEFLAQLRLRFHLIFLLNTVGGTGALANTHLHLIDLIKGQGGKVSLIGGDEVVSAGVDVFLGVEPENRYVVDTTELMIHFSDTASDPKVIYDIEEMPEDVQISEEECRQDASKLRKEEVELFEKNFLPLLKGEYRDLFESHLKNIRFNAPGPNDDMDDQPFSLSAQALSKMDWANIIEDPIETLSDLTGIPIENIPEEIIVYLEKYGHDFLKEIWEKIR